MSKPVILVNPTMLTKLFQASLTTSHFRSESRKHAAATTGVGNGAAINIHTGYVTGNPNNKGSGYDPTKKLIDHFAKVNDNYTITNSHDAYVVGV